jgi:4-diphosphocytidyl-2-C-methyl-D-erythritol kinase
MLTFPNAKINLGLNVVEKRSDGYHNIETVFYPLQLRDALELIPSSNGEFSFSSGGIPIGGNLEDNLVVKAYNLLKDKYNLPAITIYLHKTIPFGAGLGGGSSDAAFMLKMLNNYFSLNIDNHSLKEYARILGADCPFFLQNTPSFASGIGDKFKNINLSLKGYYLVLIKPDIHVSTVKAYNMIIPSHPEKSITELISLPVEQWKGVLKNDFEEGVFSLYPVINFIKGKLYETGAIYAAMSGSGSAVFGLFKEKKEIKNLFPDCFFWSEKLRL